MLKILINNEEILCDKDFTIKEEMLNTPSVILNNVYPKSWEMTHDYVSNFYYPKDYSKCKIIDYNESTQEESLLFCGVVKNTGNISLNPRYPHFCSLQILDFKTFLSEGETLDFVIYQKTITEAINQIISSISDYGFVLGNINILNPDDIIGTYSTKDKTPYDVFNYIADITQSRWTTRMIDENTVAIDFYDPTLMPEGIEIDYTKEFWDTYDIIDMSFNYGTYDYRNKQIMTSGEVLADINTIESIIANGYQKQYQAEQKIGYVNSISVDGIIKEIITNDQKTSGMSADFYYTPGNNYIESDNPLTSGSNISINYISIVEGRQIIINSSETNRISNQINRNGNITRYENRNDATTSEELQSIGESYLKYKGKPEIKLKIETTSNIWNVGESVIFNAPLNELNTTYMVKKKEINYIATINKIFYTYELSSNFNSESEINYFDNQRAKTLGNIGAGEFISRNIDIENSANIIFYNTTIEQTTITDNNILNCILNSPLNN